jgi:YtkA-like
VTLALRNPKLLWASLGAAGLLAVVLAIAALGGGGGVSQRATVYQQLQRPATFASRSVGPGPVSTALQAHGYTLAVRLGPNRASLRNALAIVLRRAGRPVSGARVTVTYSMPSMNMANVFSGRLAQSAAGTYTAEQPVFGMPGAWRLSFSVAVAGQAPVAVALDDRMMR